MINLAVGSASCKSIGLFSWLLHWCRLLGTPNEESWPGVNKLRDWHEYPQWQSQNLSRAVPDMGPDALDLLSVSSNPLFFNVGIIDWAACFKGWCGPTLYMAILTIQVNKFPFFSCGIAENVDVRPCKARLSQGGIAPSILWWSGQVSILICGRQQFVGAPSRLTVSVYSYTMHLNGDRWSWSQLCWRSLGKYVAVVEKLRFLALNPGWHSPRKLHVYKQSVLNLFPSWIWSFSCRISI